MTVHHVREPDRAQIANFVGALFTYADEGTFVSLRAFDQFDSTKGPVLIEAVEIINGGGLGTITERAALAAKRAANTASPAVFAPPIATFTNPKRASEADLANGVAVSVELDSGNSTLARQRLEGILGPATAVVEWEVIGATRIPERSRRSFTCTGNSLNQPEHPTSMGNWSRRDGSLAFLSVPTRQQSPQSTRYVGQVVGT